jgi:hypothetical protein
MVVGSGSESLTNEWIRMRIWEAQKHWDPTDPDLDSDPDPQHCHQ